MKIVRIVVLMLGLRAVAMGEDVKALGTGTTKPVDAVAVPAAGTKPAEVKPTDGAKPEDCTGKIKELDVKKEEEKAAQEKAAQEKAAQEKAIANLGLATPKKKEQPKDSLGQVKEMENCK